MDQYINLIKRVIEVGDKTPDRTGTGTWSELGQMMRFDLRDGFPMTTVRRLFWKGIVAELLWFMSGSTNTKDLPDYVRKWWEPWAQDDGELGPTYGLQFRGGGQKVDQLSNIITGIKENPSSRRHVMTMWDPATFRQTGLPPCHGTVTQFKVDSSGERLDMATYQRSADIFIGLPNNIASYALFLHIVSALTGKKPGVMTYMVGDAHIYLNHEPYINTQLERWENMTSEEKQLPTLEVPPAGSVEEYKVSDFKLVGYNPQPAIKGAPIAI